MLISISTQNLSLQSNPEESQAKTARSQIQSIISKRHLKLPIRCTSCVPVSNRSTTAKLEKMPTS